MRRPGPVALTMGDPAGVGAEIALGAWKQGASLPPFFLIDDPDRISGISGDVPVREIVTPAAAADLFPNALPVLRQNLFAPVQPGNPDGRNAAATIEAIDRAVGFCQSGEAAAVVTNPISKKVLYDGADFRHPGHTEYLAYLADVPRTVMMLAAPGLRVVPVTIHIPLSDVPSALTQALITETIEITHASLHRDFRIEQPRIAVSGLNPHAGEGGAMGTEEISVINPALDALRAKGIDVSGPLPADTMFHPAARAAYDAAVTMYHDQGLVAIKTLDFARGVNVTLGMPFIRTSPDHGTAFDIAGTGKADPTSLIEAIRLAGELAQGRQA